MTAAMRIAKLGLISFLFLFITILVISLFIPSRVRISRTKDIQASPDSVLAQISQPANWKNWYPGAAGKADLYITGKHVGIVTGKNGKKGLAIVSVTDSSVTAREAGPSSSPGFETGWNMIRTGNASCAVQWYMDIKLRWYPWEKFASLLFEKNYGTMMEQGLEQLKKESERK